MTIIRIEGDGIWIAVDEPYSSKLSEDVRKPLYDKHFHFPSPLRDSLINKEFRLR